MPKHNWTPGKIIKPVENPLLQPEERVET